MSMGSRSLYNRAEQQAYFINAVNALTDGNLVPVPGGVLIRNSQKQIIGSIGISGDTSDNLFIPYVPNACLLYTSDAADE